MLRGHPAVLRCLGNADTAGVLLLNIGDRFFDEILPLDRDSGARPCAQEQDGQQRNRVDQSHFSIVPASVIFLPDDAEQGIDFAFRLGMSLHVKRCVHRSRQLRGKKTHTTVDDHTRIMGVAVYGRMGQERGDHKNPAFLHVKCLRVHNNHNRALQQIENLHLTMVVRIRMIKLPVPPVIAFMKKYVSLRSVHIIMHGCTPFRIVFCTNYTPKYHFFQDSFSNYLK